MTKEEQKITDINRDSLMYIKINNNLKSNPKAYLITLSGNIHNQLKILRQIKTMGYYLQNDINSALRASKLLSLNHIYGAGTMMNIMSDGYLVRKTKGNAGFFGTISDYDNYLYIFQDREWFKGYSGLIYSKTVTAAMPLVDKK